ncbi:hypothetical protein [Sphaerisporangium sp. NPDC051011]
MSLSPRGDPHIGPQREGPAGIFPAGLRAFRQLTTLKHLVGMLAATRA